MLVQAIACAFLGYLPLGYTVPSVQLVLSAKVLPTSGCVCRQTNKLRIAFVRQVQTYWRHDAPRRDARRLLVLPVFSKDGGAYRVVQKKKKKHNKTELKVVCWIVMAVLFCVVPFISLVLSFWFLGWLLYWLLLFAFYMSFIVCFARKLLPKLALRICSFRHNDVSCCGRQADQRILRYLSHSSRASVSLGRDNKTML